MTFLKLREDRMLMPHEAAALRAEIALLRHDLSVMTTVRDAQAMVISEHAAENERQRAAILRHRSRVWGLTSPVGNDADEELYASVEQAAPTKAELASADTAITLHNAEIAKRIKDKRT